MPVLLPHALRSSRSSTGSIIIWYATNEWCEYPSFTTSLSLSGQGWRRVHWRHSDQRSSPAVLARLLQLPPVAPAFRTSFHIASRPLLLLTKLPNYRTTELQKHASLVLCHASSSKHSSAPFPIRFSTYLVRSDFMTPSSSPLAAPTILLTLQTAASSV